jgi:hypothetical protein
MFLLFSPGSRLTFVWPHSIDGSISSLSTGTLAVSITLYYRIIKKISTSLRWPMRILQRYCPCKGILDFFITSLNLIYKYLFVFLPTTAISRSLSTNSTPVKHDPNSLILA